MVAAKSFLTTTVISLALCAGALAGNPTVRITAADQARARAGLLQLRDLGPGWQGGAVTPQSLVTPACPGFDPKQSDLVVSGHADAHFSSTQGDIVLDQDVQVLASPAAVRTDFARTITAKFPPCLVYQLDRNRNVVRASVARIAFPRAGSISAAYRARVVVRSSAASGTIISDFVYFAAGRVEYSFNVIAPLSAANQLGPFELALASIVLRRAAAAAG